MSEHDDTGREIDESIENVIEYMAEIRGLADRSQSVLRLCLGHSRTIQDPLRASPVQVTEHLLQFRRKREAIFLAAGYADVLFGEPAWDMLLELYAIQAKGKRISVSKLCFVAGIPPTTALRYISTLTEMGLVTRLADPADGRRVWIELSAAAHDVMDKLFEG